MSGRTLFDKIWERHVAVRRDDGQELIYIDRHLCHDGSFVAFGRLRESGRKVRRPDLTFATPDHYTPTSSQRVDDIGEARAREIVTAIDGNCADNEVTLFRWGDPRQGIVHVVGPEQGLTLPGLTLVCGDSHTSTHGALGCISFGIGASEVVHVMATQTIWQKKPKTMRISVDGRLGPGVAAKDLVLAIIRRIGAAGGAGHAIEYAGAAIRALSVEGRATVCNMSIEAGARSGMVAADETTFAYVDGRPFAPKAEKWERAVAFWRTLPSDADAVFDREVGLDGASIKPMVTWGNSPQDAVAVDEPLPDPAAEAEPERRASMLAAYDYMGLKPGQSMAEVAVYKVFIGSCTNSRIEDLRAAAQVVKGRKAKVETLVVPGSGLVKAQAEAEGLDRVFKDAGMQWRFAGCSMCIAMNGDMLRPGERAASTSNRNFRGRQGLGSRTHLVSPAMAAAAAVSGRFVDVRQLLRGG
jgi:3-isopropylmalate/(R)-2-methylmalate dehydratase large subunit